MKVRKPTLTIGIPALNEYQNLCRLLKEIKRQELHNIKKLQIVIMSDGSTDKTRELIKKDFGLDIKIYHSSKRHGKPYQLNKMFKICSSDLIVVLDADISLGSNNVIAHLVSSSNKNKSSLVSGVALPEEPKNFVQRIANVGVSIWDRIRFSRKHSKLYLCEGSVRCFHNELYKKISFPNTSADEAYSYLATKRLGFKFISCQKAIVKYHLPETVRDYYLQLRRYLNSKNIQKNNFPDLNVNTDYDIHYSEKLKSLLKQLVQDPIHTSLYLLFVVLVKATVHISPAKFSSRWIILNSTKKV